MPTTSEKVSDDKRTIPFKSDIQELSDQIADLKKVVLEQSTIIKRLIQGYRPR